MKTVKSISELKRMAVQKGATIELGSDRFNAGGVKAAVGAVERRPAPVAAPMPPPAIDAAPLAQAHEKLGAMFAAAIASLPQPAAPVREWLFTVERDKDGLLTSIRAIAKE